MRKRALPLSALVTLLLACSACGNASSRASGELVVPDAFITAYSWYDNTPPGSAVISNPVLHDVAGGRGTYEDPVTIAVGHSRETGKSVLDIPAGTRIYLPHVRRYFIVEDACGDGPAPELGPCHAGFEEHGDASMWIDIWIGGEGEDRTLVADCAVEVTGVHTAVFNPGDHYAVAPGTGVIHDGDCDAGYGRAPVSH